MTQKAPQKGPPAFDWTWLDWPDIRTMIHEQRVARDPIAPYVGYAIGYGAAGDAFRLDSPAVLRAIAEGLGVTAIVDCRAQPGGARIRQGWSQGLVKEALQGSPVAYEWRGADLGGKDRHRGRGCTADGLKWLDATLRERSVVLLCACEDRQVCHIHRIVATDLADKGKRAELGLPERAPVFVHLHLSGCFTSGAEMLAASDIGVPPRQIALQALPKFRKAADEWRSRRLDIFDA